MSSVEFRKELFADERQDDLKQIGRPAIRQDIRGHVTGRTAYYDDHLFERLLHMRCARSPHHHARIRSVDTSEAARMPGVQRIVLAKDVPNNLNTLLSLINFGKDDEPLIAGTKVSYRGEAVAAVIAETELQARQAAAAIRVDWEVLPHVLDVEEALKPDAPQVNAVYPDNTFDYEPYDHVKLRFGDVHKGFAAADEIVEATYQMSPIEQAPMETCGAIAVPETADRILCHTGTQALFFSLGTTAKLLDMPSSRLHFVGGTVGGGFGGKVDSITEPMAVLGAVLTGRPVKFQWDREEEMQVGAPRGAERWVIRDGVMRDGRIVARSFTGYFDSGAYTRLSSYAGTKGVGHLPGPYSIPNVAANVFCIFTNRTPATAMRGFGITGVDFAIECHMDRVAERVGIDPISLRILNAYRDGDMKAHRRTAKNTALVECCQVVADKAGWRLSAEDRAASSLTGTTAERQAIPETALDEEGRIGERRAGRVTGTAPTERSTGRLPAGTRGRDHAAIPVQRPDMEILSERVGHRMPDPAEAGGAPPLAAAAPARPTPPAASPPPARPASASPPPASPPHAAPAPPPAPPRQPEPAQPAHRSEPTAPTAPARGGHDPAPPAQPKPYEPDKPFSRGVNRPGVSRFLTGRRR
ncbi:xanthine dehydrogenase family protein molybdopterin-binding subunit [Roseisalinus antarcticus]|uniref:Putative xanthine dehydrogenase subunit D n=1 Tax=Roseisalinus antarcticus TaxID=254357 RepID=A0A1Y5TN69_9RHOB|nr:molybdopterin cofactor-binding domain-containing protein [Roseisalinus antarcticus]SLN64165.1 putative xanthine dehydrogenase subunit D [Roseisalinus antarcticus]